MYYLLSCIYADKLTCIIMTCNKQRYSNGFSYPSSENLYDTISIELCEANYIKINLVCRLTILGRQKLRLNN